MHDVMKNVCFDEPSGDHGADGLALGSTDAGIAPQQQSVNAGPAHTLLSGRAQADAAHSLAMRPAENVPVYVMLPLDTVNAEGVFRYAYVPWFAQALHVLALSGVHGVAVDVWWCAIERAPRQYSWTGYKQLFEMVRAAGLKLQVVLSFHACGGNVGDMAQVPLPPWVLQAGLSDPDIFFTDRPRESGLGQRNKEYLSIWADDCPVLPASTQHGAGASFGGRSPGAAAAAAAGSGSGGGSGSSMRTPLQCYADVIAAFRDEFGPHLGTLIEEVVVGSGPCGELRYPSYVEANGWRFPGVGEFQCYDRRALASLAAAAEAAGHPEWGYAGPHDSGGYNSLPLDTDFFKPHGGSWDTDYGNFFLSWYSACLLQHGDRLLQLANQVFAPFRPTPQAELLPHAQAVLQQLRVLLQDGSSECSSEADLAAAAAATAVAAAGRGGGGLGPADAPTASVEECTQQAVALLAQAAHIRNPAAAAAAGSCGDCDSSSSSTGSSQLSPVRTPAAATGSMGGMAPASVAGDVPGAPSTPGAAAAAAAALQLPPNALEIASQLLQRLLRGCSDTTTAGTSSSSSNSSSIKVAAGQPASPAQLSPTLAGASAAAACSSGAPAGLDAAAAAAAGYTGPAAAAPAGAVGPGGLLGPVACSSTSTHTSCVSVPTESSLQSSSSTVDLSCSDLLSASQQHLAGLSLSTSRDSDLGTAPAASSPQQSPTPAAAAAAAPAVVGVKEGHVAAAAAPAEHCNGAVTPALVGSSSSPVAGSNGSSSDVISALPAASLAAVPAEAAAAAAAAAAVPASKVPAPCSNGSSTAECNGSIPTSKSSTTGPQGYSSTSSPAAAAAAASAVDGAARGPLLKLFLQLLSRLVPGGAQGRKGRQPQRQVSQLQLLQQRKPLVLSLKIAGVHWWYNSTSHASELTAGYYNTDSRDGYSPILELCERYAVNLTITCVEMCDAQHPSYALCGPEGLLRQIRAMAAHRNVTLSGENALPIFTASGIDATALDRVVSNVRACRMASLRSCSSWPGPGFSMASSAGSNGGYRQQHQQYHYQHSQQQQQQQKSLGWGQQQQQPQRLQHMSHTMSTGGLGAAYADIIQRQHSGGWPPPYQQSQQQQQHQQQQQQQQLQQQQLQQQQLQQQQLQQQRLLQQQHHQQQLLWYGADRMGGHQHTGSHITSNSRNFSELGTLLQVYGSGGSITSSTTPPPAAAAAGGLGAGGGGLWQRASDSSIICGLSSPNGSSGGGNASSSSMGGLQQQPQQQQQRRWPSGVKAAGGSSSGGSGDSEVLPAMRAFTFLRLGPEILQPECHTSWMRFMHRMLNERA